MKIFIIIALAFTASCVSLHNNNYPQQTTPQYYQYQQQEEYTPAKLTNPYY